MDYAKERGRLKTVDKITAVTVTYIATSQPAIPATAHLAQAFPSATLDHEVPRECQWRRRFERVQDHVLVQRVSGSHCPMVKHLLFHPMRSN